MGLKPRPTWSWDLGDERYPIIDVKGTDASQITAALARWWTKIAELAVRSDNWDTMVGDIWLDSGRIIGHVQMRDVAVGYDTGFRVAAHVDHITTSLAADNYDSKTWEAMTALLVQCAEAATELEPARSALAAVDARHPFKLEITSHGQWLSQVSR